MHIEQRQAGQKRLWSLCRTSVLQSSFLDYVGTASCSQLPGLELAVPMQTCKVTACQGVLQHQPAGRWHHPPVGCHTGWGWAPNRQWRWVLHGTSRLGVLLGVNRVEGPLHMLEHMGGIPVPVASTADQTFPAGFKDKPHTAFYNPVMASEVLQPQAADSTAATTVQSRHPSRWSCPTRA